MQKWILLFMVSLIFLPAVAPAKKWSGIVAKEFDNSDMWSEMVNQMKENHMYFGAEAASERILEYFADLKSKEFAYQNIVGLIDLGYPFSVRSAFMSGDLEVAGKENFAQSYNLYKASIDLEKKMPKWANNYFAKVDKDNFPKYLFYQALTEFKNNQLNESIGHLDKALKGLQDPNQAALSKKVARTMARIYYQQTKYQEAFDIYENYLLKMNPIEPADWLEAAWALYRLGRFEESMGHLYNLEVPNLTQDLILEKYIIRALIYREKCSTGSTKALSQVFEKDFASAIEKIKLGEPLKSLPILKRIIDRGSDYKRILRNLDELNAEKARITDLPKGSQKVAKYLYETEIKNQQKNLDFFEDQALNDAARQLVVMGESLRFLQFDVIREKYNPDKVFAPAPELPTDQPLMEKVTDQLFLQHWIQWGDYWRDERTLYRGRLKNWCQ